MASFTSEYMKYINDVIAETKHKLQDKKEKKKFKFLK